MFSIDSCPLPDSALLDSYRQSGAFTDCYFTEIPGEVTYVEYVNAFYTTAVFKLERSIIKWAVAKSSSDAQVALLAEGKADTFAAWKVEKRCKNQLLLCDYQGRTRSWLMLETVACEVEGKCKTRLYFGSAVVPTNNNATGEASLGFVFKALHGFHKLYSVVLLASARARLMKSQS